MYSLDGLLADEGTEYWQFCFGLPNDPRTWEQKIDLYQSAYAHIMGRATYEAMAGALPTADHPFTGILNAGRKVVFSRTLKTAEWANTTIAAGDTAEDRQAQARGRRPHRGLGRRWLLAVAHAARPDRRVPPGLAPLRCGRGYPAVQ
jgi:dihydrofolate reductase